MSDLNLNKINAEISAGLGELLGRGFQLRLKPFGYTRRRRELIDFFRIEICRTVDKYLVTPSVFLGVPQINKLYNAILGRKRPVNSTTIGFGVDNVSEGKRGRYHISEIADCEAVIPHLKRDFHEIAMPWFQEFHDISSVDAYLNHPNPLSGSNPTSVGYACKGLIAAHLSKKSNVGALAEKYYEHFKITQSLELANPIHITAAWLQSNPV